MLTEMQSRENTLFNNDVLLAGIYIDPKSRALLETESMIRRARDSFCNIATKMAKFNQETPHFIQETPPMAEFDEFNESNTLGTTFEDKLNYITNQRLREIQKNKSNRLQNFKTKIMEGLNCVEMFDRSKPILEVIKSYPNVIKPTLFICTSMPCSQASVERLFSALNFIQSPRKCRSKGDLVCAEMFLRVNGYE